MPVISALADRLVEAGQANELYRYETLWDILRTATQLEVWTEFK